METQPKLSNSKEVISYLAQKFPLCFIAEGEAKPLKIGIFQDLVKRLEDDTTVSKTQLRSALRLYTTSWRYLHGVKVGAERVDLDGNTCGVLDQEHVDFARKQLEEAKAKIKAKKKELNKTEKPAKRVAKPVSAVKTENKANNPVPKKVQDKVKTVKQSVIQLSETEIANLKTGQKVKVRVGKNAMDATLLEINKEGVRVQLTSGMSMSVRPEHLVITK